MIHAVGKAAANGREPRLVELEWGPADAPRVAIVGKGVVFDSGGLDIKPAAALKLMKQDMGGEAPALALAGPVMANYLTYRLHLVIPTVEHATPANPLRPAHVPPPHNGIQVEEHKQH